MKRWATAQTNTSNTRGTTIEAALFICYAVLPEKVEPYYLVNISGATMTFVCVIQESQSNLSENYNITKPPGELEYLLCPQHMKVFQDFSFSVTVLRFTDSENFSVFTDAKSHVQIKDGNAVHTVASC